ncbi:MAG: HAD-IA family hydrolase [Deltaproteobacteria bacterium]|nr:HAD-IA family hydrolase [Deltaproteobacteria bacterium]
MHGLLLFDLDGTLLDSKKDIALSVNYALSSTGNKELPEETIIDFVGRGLPQLIGDCLNSSERDPVQTVVEAFWTHYQEHLLDHSQLYPGVLDFLQQDQHHKKAVVTNKPYAFSKKILEELNISHHFDWLIGGDSLPIQKPDAGILKPILDDLKRKGLSTQKILMVGDSKIDIDTGKNAGIQTCGVTYGLRPRQELVDCQPDYLIENFGEFSKIGFFQ